MKKEKVAMNRILISLLCLVVIVFSLITLIFTIQIVVNKNSRTEYDKLSQTDRKMIEAVNEYILNLNKDSKNANLHSFDKPIAFVKQNGLTRGRAYIFNVPLTEHKLAYGCSGGTFAAEILMPDEMNLPTLYRCTAFVPNLGSFLFPADYKVKELCGQDVYVIGYNNSMLEDGSFQSLLDRVFKK